VNLAANKAAAQEHAKGNDNLVVAYHPAYQNADGTKSANVVMTKGEAQAQGLHHYKADPTKPCGRNGSGWKIIQLCELRVSPLRHQCSNPEGIRGCLDSFGVAIFMDGPAVFIGRQIDREIDRLGANCTGYFW
jgi:hypothetical protein